LRKYATQKLLFCPPQSPTQCCYITLGKLFIVFSLSPTDFSSVVYVGGSEKSRFFGAEMRMQTWR